MQVQNLSNYKLFSANQGQLIPCGLYECIPTDYIRHRTQFLIRTSPMNAPVMHPTKAYVRHFQVPMRLLWEGWEDFITGADDGASTFPTITVPNDPENNAPLLDYLGIPPEQQVEGMEISALPVRAFNAVFNEYFRDQDLVDPRDPDDMTIPNVAWERDPFTASRPWAQKGAVVSLPMSGTVNIEADGEFELEDGQGDPRKMGLAGGNTNWLTDAGVQTNWASYHAGLVGNPEGMQLDVLDVRKSMALQRYAEARAQYGSRHVEYLRYIGVKGALDARLNNPEYLGGGSKTLSYSEVLSTADTGQSEVGDLKGHGIVAMRSNAFRKYIQEFGYILSVFYVRPKTIYMQGIDRHWLKRSKEDFFQKELMLIGNQEVYTDEVYADNANNGSVLGYFDRYYDYTRVPSRVAGEFRNVLDYWHQGRSFDQAPVLNGDFVTANPDPRIYQDRTNTNHLKVMTAHSVRARRPVRRAPVGRII